MELEQTNGEFKPERDERLRMPEPLPVRLVAVEDVTLPAPAGVEVELDALYVKLLGFERAEDRTTLVYHAENHRLIFDVREAPVTHTSMRALAIEVQSLQAAEEKLIAAEIEYTRQKGIAPGMEGLLLLDPAGNWIELVQVRGVR